MRCSILSVFAVGLLIAICIPVWGHEVETHEEMSQKALETSVVANDPKLLLALSLQPLSQKQKFPNSRNDNEDVINLIRDGSRFEDNTETVKRPLNHFFDPLRDKPLTVLCVPLGETSPDWALESPNEIGSQHYSLRDARDSLYRALTGVSKSDRDKNFWLSFQTLGHVIHHLRDMTQPQHVRNDASSTTASHRNRSPT